MKNIIVYGTGKAFTDFILDEKYFQYLILDNDINIMGISDGNISLGKSYEIGGQKYEVRDVLDFATDAFDKILVSSRRYFNEIKKDLVKKGIEIGKIDILDAFLNEVSISNYTKYRLALVLIVKNEAQYIEEWIEYHLLKGIDHFYIYDDNSDDGLEDILIPYIKADIVTYHKWKHELGQSGAYYDAVSKYKYETKYMGFIDTDEFLVTKGKEDVFDVIEGIRKEFEYDQVPYHLAEQHFGGVGVTFRYFGTSNHKKKPKGLVTESFVNRANDNHPDHSFIKSIVNPRVVTSCDVHHMIYVKNYVCISENGSIIPIRNFMDSKYEKIWINHYWCKSEEEMFKKFIRGWIAGFRTDVEQADRIKLFDKELKAVSGYNEIFDDGLLMYSDEIKRKIAKRRNSYESCY